jgi:hypothetical protein
MLMDTLILLHYLVAGGGGRTRTELSLQRILSRIGLIVTMRNYWFSILAHVKMCKFMCKFWRKSYWS